MVDPVTDAKYAVFEANDRAFLARMFAEYPKVEANFEKYLAMDNFETRGIRAMMDLREITRSGWVRHGIENAETVDDHTKYVAQYAMNRAPQGIDRFRAYTMALFHDLPEVMITDFTPHDKITSDEKIHLELLALAVLTDKKDVMEPVKEYIAQATPLSHWVHDVDKIDPLFVALQYEAQDPQQLGLFEEFYDYTAPRIKTDAGKAILADVREHAADYREAYKKDFGVAAR